MNSVFHNHNINSLSLIELDFASFLGSSRIKMIFFLDFLRFFV